MVAGASAGPRSECSRSRARRSRRLLPPPQPPQPPQQHVQHWYPQRQHRNRHQRIENTIRPTTTQITMNGILGTRLTGGGGVVVGGRDDLLAVVTTHTYGGLSAEVSRTYEWNEFLHLSYEVKVDETFTASSVTPRRSKPILRIQCDKRVWLTRCDR